MNISKAIVKWILILLVIIVLCDILFRSPVGMTDKARVTTTRATLNELHKAVNMFKLDMERYPTEAEGLHALIEKPDDTEGWKGYLETTEVPTDTWKNPLIYRLNPDPNTPFVIISYGADGREGGTGYDADLYSTDLK